MSEGGVVVHPGHVAGMAGVMDSVAGRYDAAAKFVFEKALPRGNGWTGLLEQLKTPLTNATSVFTDRQKARAQDARTSKDKFMSAARLYAGTDQGAATTIGGNGEGGSSAGADVEAEDYPSADDVDCKDPDAPDSKAQDDLRRVVEHLAGSGVGGAVAKLTGKSLVDEVLKPFVADWPELVRIGRVYAEFGRVESRTMEVVDSGRRQLAENWQGGAADAADALLKDRVGGGDAPIGAGMAQLLSNTHDAIEQTIQGLVQYLQDGLGQQGSYKGQAVTVAQLAVNADHLPAEVGEELKNPLAEFAEQALTYVATGQQIIDEAKQAIAGLEAGSSETANTGASTREVSGVRKMDFDPDPRDPNKIPGHATPAPGQIYDSGLGDPVDGTKLDSWPQPPEWHSEKQDGGAGPYGSKDPTAHDYLTEKEIEGGAWWKDDTWPHAASNLKHYMDESGTGLEQDVNAMLGSIAGFQARADQGVHDLGAEAIHRAQEQGASGPVTFPINTPWMGYVMTKDQNADWFYATGSFSYNLTGQVTVYPPSEPGGEWRYESNTAVNYRDRYNWDFDPKHPEQSKKIEMDTPFGKQVITDREMGRMQEVGLAREYDMYGRSSLRQSSGRG